MGRMRHRRAVLRRVDEKNPMATGIHSLAEELVQEVLRYLQWPTDFYNLSLVCRMFYRHATHELYSTLVIAYHRPERISALLALLQAKHERASLVTTILFDEDIKSIGPNLPEEGKWPPHAHPRELTDGWDPTKSPPKYSYNRHCADIASRLQAILLSLPNLKRVLMRNLHPFYLHPGLSEEAQDLFPNIPSDSARDLPVLDIWQCILNGPPHITEIYVNGITGGMPSRGMLSVLTTVCISDLFLVTGGHALAAHSWNAALAHAPGLQTLAMVHVEHAHVILKGRYFPQLQALELYQVYLTYPEQPESQVFLTFLHRHSPTLRILALSSPLWGPIDHRRWLKNNSILLELHTLRLDQIWPLLGTEAELVPGSPLADRSALFARGAAVIAEKTEVLIEFVKHRPKILDLAISDLSRPEADEFAQLLVATRPMRNLFIGEPVCLSHRSRTCRPAQPHWHYGCEAWSVYELFAGLTISKSGFRPTLPRPPPWKFWKKAVV